MGNGSSHARAESQSAIQMTVRKHQRHTQGVTVAARAAHQNRTRKWIRVQHRFTRCQIMADTKKRSWGDQAEAAAPSPAPVAPAAEAEAPRKRRSRFSELEAAPTAPAVMDPTLAKAVAEAAARARVIGATHPMPLGMPVALVPVPLGAPVPAPSSHVPQTALVRHPSLFSRTCLALCACVSDCAHLVVSRTFPRRPGPRLLIS